MSSPQELSDAPDHLSSFRITSSVIHLMQVSSPRELSDTLVLHDLSRLSRETSLAFQAKRIVPGLQKDLKRRLDRIVKNPVLVYEVYEIKNTTQ